jgi:hypothetical protein
MINHFPINHNNASSLFAEQPRHYVVSVKLGNSHPVEKESNEARQCHVQGQTARHHN